MSQFAGKCQLDTSNIQSEEAHRLPYVSMIEPFFLQKRCGGANMICKWKVRQNIPE